MRLLTSDIDEIIDNMPATMWQEFSGKRVLLTGGRGFLGRYFTDVFVRLNARLLEPARERPVELVVLDNLIASGEAGAAPLCEKHVAFIKHDIIEPFTPERPIHFILHAAGIASPFWYRKFPIETYRVATIGTHNVLELARRHVGCRVAFFSSSEIYGDPDPKHVPTNESYRGYVSSLGPRACYDESKRMGEMMVRVHHEQHGVHGMIIRPFNFYGPGMQSTDYRVLPNFAARWVEGAPLHVYGDGKQTRTFCYVTDGIRGCLRALLNGTPGEPYNIGNPSPEIGMADLARKVGDVTGAQLAFDTVEHPDTYPADEPQRRCPDITKARVQLGYEPLVSLDDGLRRFFGWANIAFRQTATAASAA